MQENQFLPDTDMQEFNKSWKEHTAKDVLASGRTNAMTGKTLESVSDIFNQPTGRRLWAYM